MACRDIAGQGEQHCGDSKPCCGGDVPQRLFQQTGQQHSAAQQGQHTKNDPVLRHKKQRDRCDKHPCPKHLCAPAQGMMPQLHAKAGQQNKYPTDALLPQMPGQAIWVLEVCVSGCRRHCMQTTLQRTLAFIRGGSILRIILPLVPAPSAMQFAMVSVLPVALQNTIATLLIKLYLFLCVVSFV